MSKQVKRDTRLFTELSEALLREGYGVRFRPHGYSMWPAIDDGEPVTAAALSEASIAEGKVVLADTDDGLRAHRVVRVGKTDLQTRGDCSDDCDAPVTRARVMAEIKYVERFGMRWNVAEDSLYCRAQRAVALARWAWAAPGRAARSLVRALTVLALVAAMSAAAAAEVRLYGYSTTNIYQINSTTGAATSIYTIPTPLTSAGALAYDVQTGYIYYFDEASGNSTCYRWDPQNPGNAPVLQFTLAGTSVNKAVIDQNRILYMVLTNGTSMLRRDMASGATGTALTPVALSGGPSGVGDIAFHANGTLYLVNSTTLYSINTGTGAVTSLGAITGLRASDTITGMSARNGTLYIVGTQTTLNDTLYTLDASTRVATAVNNTNANTGVSGATTSRLGDLASQTARADITITKTSSGTFTKGFAGAYFILTVSNTGNAATSGTVTVTDNVPSAVTVTSAAGPGWTCNRSGNNITCTRADALAAGSTYPDIIVTTSVPTTAANSASNTGNCSGGGENGSYPFVTTDNSSTLNVTINPAVCGTLPAAGSTNLTGTINSYYPGTANVAANTLNTTISVGARSGAAVTLAVGDLVIIMQMQDATINSTNTDSYGDGVSSTPANGSTALNNSGLWEYARVTSVPGSFPGSIGVEGAGSFGGLVNSYSVAAADGTNGQKTFQVIRVPVYDDAVIQDGNLSALRWNGSVGGVLAFGVSDTLNLNSQTVNLTGYGFRGGGGRQLTGAGTGANTDYRAQASNNANGIKGEGIAGTPRYVYNQGTGALLDTAVTNGYPNGSAARGAPGNAGGGGTDADATNNDENTGGGGGGNGGAGGRGGNSWSNNLARGGHEGAAFTPAITRVSMGGGGGAGSSNNGETSAGTDNDGLNSSGSAGGGIVIIRARAISGNGTITVDGANALHAGRDGGGGAGAGGTIVFMAGTGNSLAGLTMNARGGTGGNAWPDQAAGSGCPTSGSCNYHGPGGGGGGGVIIVSDLNGTEVVTGGANGITTTNSNAFGSTSGSAGQVISSTLSSVPGALSTQACTPDLTIVKTSPMDFQESSAALYNIVVSNASSYAYTSGTVTFTDTVDSNFNTTGLTASGTGWTCNVVTRTITCTRTDALAPSSSYPPIVITGTLDNNVPANISNTGTIAGGGETNTSNNSSTVSTPVDDDGGTSADVRVAISQSANPVNLDVPYTYTITVTNPSSTSTANAATTVVSFPIPTGVTYVSSTGTGCVYSAGPPAVLTCSLGTLNIDATQVITVTVNPTTLSIGQQVQATATASTTTKDINISNNSATIAATIQFPTSVTLIDFTAARSGSEVALVWSTAEEVRNLGFNVYREDANGRVKLNDGLIAGSALMTRIAYRQHSAKTYGWIDPNGSADATYYLEDLDVSGETNFHAPARWIDASEAEEIAAVTALARKRPQTLRELAVSISQTTEQGRKAVRAAWPRDPRPAPEATPANALKVMVAEPGWYRVTAAQIAAAGLGTPNLDYVRLYSRGVEHQRFVRTISGQRAIEFYATGTDTHYTGERAYWLVPGTTTATNAAASRAVAPSSFPASFVAQQERRDRSIYLAALLNGERSNFFGQLIAGGAVQQTLLVPGVNPLDSAATMTVTLQGVLANGSSDVEISLNGAVLGEIVFTGQQNASKTFNVSPGTLLSGANTITFRPLGGGTDISLVESVKVNYRRTYTADSDYLAFTLTGQSGFQLTGFTSPQVRVVEVTNEKAAREVGVLVTSQNGTYTVRGTAPAGTGTRRFVAFADSRVMTPLSASLGKMGGTIAPTTGSDIVVVTAPEFVDTLAEYSTRRAAQGLTTSIFTVEQIYNGYGNGEKDPLAIRNFLSAAQKTWTRKPRYLLLVGDASLDSRNFMGFADDDIVPTKLLDTNYMETASDDWYSDFDNTGVGKIATGRLPVHSVEELELVLDKIAAYEDSADTWKNDALLVSDVNLGYDFTEATFQLQRFLPNMNVSRVIGQNVTASTARTQILTGLQAGQGLVSYTGHGSVEVWSGSNLFKSSTAHTLTNAPRVGVFVHMTCLNGFFHDVFTTSLAEALLLSPDGGAVAVWASSGLADAGPQFIVQQRLVSDLNGTNVALGDAVLRAKQTTGDVDVRRTWILFGDPAMRVKLGGE